MYYCIYSYDRAEFTINQGEALGLHILRTLHKIDYTIPMKKLKKKNLIL